MALSPFERTGTVGSNVKTRAGLPIGQFTKITPPSTKKRPQKVALTKTPKTIPR